MAIDLTEFESDVPADDVDAPRWIDRSTAQALTAALATLAVATLVVTSSSNAFTRSGAGEPAGPVTGTVTLDVDAHSVRGVGDQRVDRTTSPPRTSG